MSGAPLNPIGLYIHWPFCTAICPYCDFNIYRDRSVDAGAWSAALVADLEYWAARIVRRPLASIYFGGGTPSLAPVSVVGDVIATADRLFGLEPHAEITLEANPNDASEDRLKSFAMAGVNRLSLGVQSFDDTALKFLGRDHNGKSVRRAIDLARKIFPSSTFDLIYGRPNQSDDAWRAELSEALQFSPTHLSLYQLTIEPGTAFAKQVEKKRWVPADDESQARHFEIARDETAAAGLNAYEVSNYAISGKESRHNLLYWRYQDYIGIGPGGHGRLSINGARIATKAVDRPAQYLSQIKSAGNSADTEEVLDDDAQLIERLSMGLRLAEGVPLYADDYFYRDDGRAQRLRRFVDDGYLSLDCGTLRTTGKGRPVLNRLLYELLG